MDMYSYMAFLRGVDGSFAFLKHTPNIRPDGALASGMLYNSYVPVFRDPADSAAVLVRAAGLRASGTDAAGPDAGGLERGPRSTTLRRRWG